MDPFIKIVEATLKAEGGYVNHPSDRGGETNWGITAGLARAHNYQGLMKDLPRETAIEIYRKEFWVPLACDFLVGRHESLATELFDSAVNVGKTRAVRWLQTALWALSRGEKLYKTPVIDGVLKNSDRAALNALPLPDYATLYKCLNVLQGAHYINLAVTNASQQVFIRGWLTRVHL